MRSTIYYSTTLETVSCGVCGIPFAMPEDILRRHLQEGTAGPGFWCPNGHSLTFTTSENAKLRTELDQAKADAEYQRGQRQLADRRAEHQANRVRAMKGVLTKTKQRAAKGVCPAPGCKRSFVNVAKHVATCHPDLHVEDSDEGRALIHVTESVE